MSTFNKKEFADKVLAYCKFFNEQERKRAILDKADMSEKFKEKFKDFDPYIGLFVMMLPSNVISNITRKQALQMASVFETTYNNQLKQKEEPSC